MTAASYPAERTVDVILRDGSTVHAGPVRPDDARALELFLTRCPHACRAGLPQPSVGH
jgi:hypothetical protein